MMLIISCIEQPGKMLTFSQILMIDERKISFNCTKHFHGITTFKEKFKYIYI